MNHLNRRALCCGLPVSLRQLLLKDGSHGLLTRDDQVNVLLRHRPCHQEEADALVNGRFSPSLPPPPRSIFHMQTKGKSQDDVRTQDM